ncbi:MAG: ABC transporter ATP-binding protein [Metallosphaera yellowstonensis]|jgi:ABC-type multidrug transport system, ATPase component|uniref:ABC-type multidrug transport system, ATPase component n=1 Tax=Metallosphaera yellowstonensis MK1 TaxID=671065 RepID=H2C648_9CREN|nr:ABC transporter ATP-binding protein [Metallosphaera yellowstonensis]EHP69275.1 ABC-type multidrug transport system, ATPase component [Metallosphaera yellowstonensis MK1]
MECIRVAHVSKRYGEVVVLDNLSFDIPCQERYSLLGPNGAGKSTTMKILAGLAKPDSGEVKIMGWDPESLEAKRVLGYLPEDALPYRNLSVRENLEYIASLRELSDGEYMVETLLDRLGLRQYERVQAGKLSRGNLQKLAIALAIIHSPKVLLLDEPLNYLDIPTQEEVISLLKEMNSTFLISTHIMSIALRLTDNVILMSHGRIIWRGSISELKLLGKENEPIESVVARMMRGAG